MHSNDLKLVNGRIITLDPARPVAEAVLVRDGRIEVVGSTIEVRAAGNSEPEFDCEGRTVVPGFIDGHAHLEMTCCALVHCLSCTTPPFSSLAGIAQEIKQRAEQTPKGEWVIARSSFGMQTKVDEGRLFHRVELDAISSEHPIIVYAGLHVTMLNTMALKALGLWDRVDSPPRGTVMHKDDDGSPTGVVTEIWDLMPEFGREQVKSAIREKITELFLANGVTTIHNLPYGKEDIQAVQELQESGDLPNRIRFYYHVPHHVSVDQLVEMGLKSGFGNDFLRYGGVKLFIDGTGHDGYGNRLFDVKWDQEELDEIVWKSHQNDLQLWMHSLSQPAIDMGLTAIERALEKRPAPHRHRLEHSGDFADSPEQMDRLQRAGALAVATPQFIYSQGDKVGDRFPRNFRYRSLIDRGFGIIGSSDSTGTVPDGIAPLFNISCAVNRRTLRGNHFLPEESVTVEEALKMFTIWPAFGAFEEQDKGSIEHGKFGDFAVLSDNILKVEPEALSEVKVDATIIGGRPVFER
jgi:predicted amidohydrolase YtcJ